MTAPKIEALRRAYERAAIESRQRGDQPWCLPNTVGFIYDAGLKAVAEMAIGAASAPMPEDAYKRLGNKSYWAAQADAERGRALRAETERDAARAEARQARREKNQALHELAATRRDAEKAHEALKAEAGRLRGERDAGIVEIAAMRARVAEAERVAVACNESAAANQLAAFTDREEAKRLREVLDWVETANQLAAFTDREEAKRLREVLDWVETWGGLEGEAHDRVREALRGGPGQGGDYEETDYIRAWARANQKSLPLTRDHYERAMAERPKGGGA